MLNDEIDVIFCSVTRSPGASVDADTARQTLPQLSVATQKLSNLAHVIDQLPEASEAATRQRGK